MRLVLPFLALSLASSALGATPEPDPVAPLSADLSGYDTPFPVNSFSFPARGRTLQMAYMDVAPEGGATRGTVVLLHGKNFSGAYWERTASLLVEKGHRVVIPDQIGFGRSSKPDDLQYSFHALAGWTDALLEAIGAEDVTVVGHSMGGMVGARLVLDHPDRARALVLVNPIGLEDWRRLTPYRDVDAWTERNLRQTPDGVREYMRNAYFDGQWKEAWEPLVALQAGWSIGPDRELLARVSALHYDMIYSQPVVHEFPDIDVPTLLIIGERDRTALNKDLVDEAARAELGRYDVLGERAAEAIPDATLVELPGIGHVPQVEAWKKYKKALVTFLDAQEG